MLPHLSPVSPTSSSSSSSSPFPPSSSPSPNVEGLEKEKQAKVKRSDSNDLQQQQEEKENPSRVVTNRSTPSISSIPSHTAATAADHPKKMELKEPLITNANQPPIRSGLSHYFQKPPPIPAPTPSTPTSPVPNVISATSPTPSLSSQVHRLNSTIGNRREQEFEDSLGLSSTELDAILQMDFESSLSTQTKTAPEANNTTYGRAALNSSSNPTGHPSSVTASATTTTLCNQNALPPQSTMPPPPPQSHHHQQQQQQQQQPINGICDICREASVDAENPLLRCAQCGVIVHASCYGVTTHSPSIRWQCDVRLISCWLLLINSFIHSFIHILSFHP